MLDTWSIMFGIVVGFFGALSFLGSAAMENVNAIRKTFSGKPTTPVLDFALVNFHGQVITLHGEHDEMFDCVALVPGFRCFAQRSREKEWQLFRVEDAPLLEHLS